MHSLYLLAAVIAASLVTTSTVDVASIPPCARICLTNSTAVASKCTSIDVQCLCNDSAFVSALSCCLSTQCTIAEQVTAIQFNQEQCAAVNASAPNFVGCSPLGLTTSVAGNNTITAFTTASTGKNAASTLSGRSTITTIETLPGSYTNSETSAVTFPDRPLFTGSCTQPFFALAGQSSSMTLFPEIGCAPDRPDCCAVPINANAVIDKCPQDYFTTASGCCPTGYSVYYQAIGLETPCYSAQSTALVPASSPTISGLTVITDHVFSKRYVLVASNSGSSLAPGAIAGIAVGGVALVVGVVAVLWFLRRKRKSKASGKRSRGVSTFPPEEPVMPPVHEVTSPQELESPEMVFARSTQQQQWPFFNSSPPAYDGEKPRPNPAKVIAPQELPGSTYINEHHPTPAGSESELEARPVTPATPTKSGTTSGPVSPAVSPAPMPHDDTGTPAIDGWVSPIGSPEPRK